jgi:hypothetical protein
MPRKEVLFGPSKKQKKLYTKLTYIKIGEVHERDQGEQKIGITCRDASSFLNGLPHPLFSLMGCTGFTSGKKVSISMKLTCADTSPKFKY